MTLEERVAAIEARQRDHGMHDPDCDQRRADKLNNAHGYGVIGRCDCWLAEPSDAVPA